MLLSIVIPTRNRQQYCIAVIDNILSYPNQNLELCIQDNSDDNQIELHIQQHYTNDVRLKYKFIKGQINSLINIGSSVGLASGKFVILLGDDDTILPSIFDAVNWMDQNDIDSLASTTFVEYYWPNAHPIHQGGFLKIPQFSTKFAPQQIDVQRQVKRLFDQGIVNYLTYGLPRAYHGIVRRELMERIKEKTGMYAGGLSPDIYICVSLTSLVRNHYTITEPISIAGACSSSSTSQNASKGHRGDLSSAPHLYLRGPYEWDSLVPAYYSGDTIWAESALKAVTDMGIGGLRERFNFTYLAARSLLYNRSIFGFCWRKTFVNRKHKTLSKIAVCFMILAIGVKVVARKFSSKSNSIEFDNIVDIDNAVKKYKEYYNL